MWLQQIREQGKCRWLFSSLLTLFLLYPHLEKGDSGRLLLALLYSVICLLAVWVSSRSRRRLIMTALTALPMIASSWISAVETSPPSLLVLWTSIALFFLVTAATMFTYVTRGESVTSETIYGGISVYLLLGLAWFAIYNVVEIWQPGSFRGLMETGGPAPAASELLYFSFVTLTTVGYGDVTPVNSYARSLAILEAISGVLYVATFVARLVALYRPEE